MAQSVPYGGGVDTQRPTSQEGDPKVTAWNPGRAVAAGRALSGHTQKELARRLAIATGDDWNRDKVANIERGTRTFDVDTLRHIAKIQGLPYSFYLEGEMSGVGDNPGSPNFNDAIRRMELLNANRIGEQWIDLTVESILEKQPA